MVWMLVEMKEVQKAVTKAVNLVVAMVALKVFVLAGL
jgi:hypothetical protein